AYMELRQQFVRIKISKAQMLCLNSFMGHP
ncbi:hypothetical protein PM8797T_08604, partial [Gimesia maris DSM 8797]